MTYKTRQEVFRAAADWMDVCEKAGVEPVCKHFEIYPLSKLFFDGAPESYEFPLALLEGKEVWVGSEVYGNNSCAPQNRRKVVAKYFENNHIVMEDGGWYEVEYLSWNPPKPATVMVEIPLATAEWYAANKYAEAYQPYFVSEACKKALENMK